MTQKQANLVFGLARQGHRN